MYAGTDKRHCEDARLARCRCIVREGAIIVRGDILKSNDNWDANWAPKLRIEIFPARPVRSEFAYYTGEAVRQIAVRPAGEAITVTAEDLGTPGELEIYCQGVRGVQRDGATLREGADYHYDAATNKLTIPFQNASSVTILGAMSLFDSTAAP